MSIYFFTNRLEVETENKTWITLKNRMGKILFIIVYITKLIITIMFNGVKI